MKMFKHEPITLPKLEKVTDPVTGKRFYVTPQGNHYTSVTTFLGSMKNDALDKWKKKVGSEEAKRISQAAASRGTALHTMFENLINNDPEPTKGCTNFTSIDMFKQLSQQIKENVNVVYGLEQPMYSDIMRLAGTTDLIANWKGNLSICDFKSSTKSKRKEWIENYFMQTAAYSIMLEEHTGMVARNLVIIIAVEETGRPQIFEASRTPYIRKLTHLIKENPLLLENIA